MTVKTERTQSVAKPAVDLRHRPLNAEGLVKAKADLRKHFGK